MTMWFELSTAGTNLPVPVEGWPLARVEPTLSSVGIMRVHFDRKMVLHGIDTFEVVGDDIDPNNYFLSFEMHTTMRLFACLAGLVPAIGIEFREPICFGVNDVLDVSFVSRDVTKRMIPTAVAKIELDLRPARQG